MKTTQDSKPHTVQAQIESDGEVRLVLVCPYELEPDRPCKMGLEPYPDRCEWVAWENGEHHKSCPIYQTGVGVCAVDALGMSLCWSGKEPEECDGWDSSEVGHIHEVKGCWANECIGEWGGWYEAVRWYPKQFRTLPLPAMVNVDCDDDGVTLCLWEPEDMPDE